MAPILRAMASNLLVMASMVLQATPTPSPQMAAGTRMANHAFNGQTMSAKSCISNRMPFKPCMSAMNSAVRQDV